MSIKCSEVVNFNLSMSYYRLITQIMEEEIKYIRGYKSLINEYFKKTLTLQVNSGSKLAKLPDDFVNATWIDSAPILKLTMQVPTIIQKQIENIKKFVEEIEKSLISLEDFYKKKSSDIKRYQAKYDEVSNDLIKKYIDIEKDKISFLNSISKSEEIITKLYENKKKIDEVNKGKIKMNDNDLKLLNDKNKEYESQKKSQINSTKKYENEYKNTIKKSIKYEDKFLTVINDCINGVKDTCGEITDKIKDTIICFLSTIRDSFKIPLNLIENNLSFMQNLNEKEIISKTMEGTFNNEKKLLHIVPVRYNLKTLEIINTEVNNNRNSKGSKGSKGSNSKKKKKNEKNYNNGYIKFEDNFEEMSYFEDDNTLLIVKEMFNNFELVNHNGLDIKVEEEKNRAKTYINKFISNISQEANNLINDNNIFNIDDSVPFTEEEKNNLIKLLNKHHNRVIFLHKLNDYRTFSQFELKEKEYKIAGELFSNLIEISKQERDYHSVEMAIILSKTYYKLENNEKIYLQNLIRNNGCLKTKEFWQDILLYSISKEMVKSKKTDEDNIINENKLNEKISNIVFSQLLSIIDNMFDFDVDGDMIKKLIDPIIDSYKLNDNLKKTINDVIESKLKTKNKNESSKEK